jgi:hypothetical protein
MSQAFKTEIQFVILKYGKSFELYQESVLSNCDLILVRAPTTKAVGSIDVTKLEPTASVVELP